MILLKLHLFRFLFIDTSILKKIRKLSNILKYYPCTVVEGLWFGVALQLTGIESALNSSVHFYLSLFKGSLSNR